MVKYSEAQLSSLFTALGDPVRRAVVISLASGERSLSNLAGPFDITMAAVMKHIAVLERCGLVETEKRGRTRYCRLQPDPLAVAEEWLAKRTAFWTERLEALARHVEENP